MTERNDRKDADSDAWTEYRPSPEEPWDVRRVVHLHRRAGLAATWAEIQRDVAEGPERSLDRLLNGKAEGPHSPKDFESTSALLADAAAFSNDPARLRAAWLYRLLFTPDPLGERLALLWHGHFATSNEKVDDLVLMRRQNDLFRKLARAPFGELLSAVVCDPALLFWLDGQSNRKGHPNENLARELMELFTLGIGNFTESDVREAARALTGWTVEDGNFRNVDRAHDDGEKTILGRVGRWSGTELIGILLEQPATATRLSARLCSLFFGEGAISDREVAALGKGLGERQLDVGWAVRTVLRSRLFFAEKNLRCRVVGPVEFVVGAVRALEMLDPPPSTLALADWATRLGQNLFYPPNVAGWQGGRAWLTNTGLVGRANFATALVRGHGIGRTAPFDAVGLAARNGRGRDLADGLAFLAELLLGGVPDDRWQSRMTRALGPGAKWDGETARTAVALLLASPDAQLC